MLDVNYAHRTFKLVSFREKETGKRGKKIIYKCNAPYHYLSITTQIRGKGRGDATQIIDKVTINRQIDKVTTEPGLSTLAHTG